MHYFVGRVRAGVPSETLVRKSSEETRRPLSHPTSTWIYQPDWADCMQEQPVAQVVARRRMAAIFMKDRYRERARSE